MKEEEREFREQSFLRATSQLDQEDFKPAKEQHTDLDKELGLSDMT